MASDKTVIDGSSIVEMEIVDGDESDYEVDLSGSVPQQEHHRKSHTEDEDSSDAFSGVTKGQIASGVASYVWSEGQERAKKAFSVYGNIDILRPYFDVEPQVVRNRLLHSLIPRIPSTGNKQEVSGNSVVKIIDKVPRELYGPTMLVFTMIALLLFQMKLSDHTVQEGTLMGTAFGVCFTYWLGVSTVLWSMTYICNTHLSLLQILSLLGYALFGHCIALFLGTVIHSGHSHLLFYAFWLTFGGLSTLRMVSVLYSRTSGKTQRMIVCGMVAALHMLFLLYLHFAYHQIVQDISYAMGGQPVNPQMVAQDNIAEVPSDLAKPLVPDHAEVAAKVVTDSVRRIIRDVRVLPDGLPIINDTLAKTGSKIVEAIAPVAPDMGDVLA